MVNINLFNAGLSDTDAFVSKGQFPYGENISISKSPEHISLGPKITETANITSNDKDMYCGLFAKAGSLSNVFFLGETGYGYASDGTNVLQTTDANDIVAVFQYKMTNEYIVWIQDDGVMGRIKVSEAYNSADWTGETSYDEAWKSLDTNDDRHHYLKWNNVMYVTGGKSVYQLTSAGELIQVIDDFSGTVVGIADNGTMIRVYTNDGYMHLWNGASDSPEATINMTNSDIRAVYGIKNRDWVLGGATKDKSTLLVSNGYQYDLIKKGVDLDEGFYDLSSKGKFKFFQSKGNNVFAEYQDMMFVLDDDGITQFGKEYPTSPLSFNKLVTTDASANAITACRCVFTNGSILYFMAEVSGKKFLATLDIDADVEFTRIASGYFYTQRFLMGNVKRYINETYLRADVPTNTTVVVKYSLDGSDTRTTLATITATTDKRHILPAHLEFHEIQYKFDMTTTSASVTPKIYEIGFNPLPMNYEGQS